MSCADLASSADPDRTFLRSLGWPSPRLIDAVLADLPQGSLPDDPQERQRWLLYALLQRTADSRVLDSLTWANEDRISEYLDRMVGGELPADSGELGPWLKYLPGNRAQKHARRRRLLERFRNDLLRPEPPRPEAEAERIDDLAQDRGQVRRLTSEREWHLLQHAAAEGLEAVAESECLPLGTLKSLLSRCRARLRQALIGAA